MIEWRLDRIYDKGKTYRRSEKKGRLSNLHNFGIGFATSRVPNEIFGVDAADFSDDGRHDRLQIVSLHQTDKQLRQRRRRALVMSQDLVKSREECCK